MVDVAGSITGVLVMPTSGVISVVPTSPLGTVVIPAPELMKLVCHSGEALGPELSSASKA